MSLRARSRVCGLSGAGGGGGDDDDENAGLLNSLDRRPPHPTPPEPQ